MANIGPTLSKYVGAGEISSLLESDKFGIYAADTYLALDGVTDDYSALYALINTTINGDDAEIWFKDGACLIGTSITIPSNIKLVFLNGGTLKPESGVTITIDGVMIDAGNQYIFDLSVGGAISGTPNTPEINVKWYGATGNNSTDDTEALQSAFDAVESNYGGAVYFPKGIYRYTSLDVKPKTKMFSKQHEMATLRHEGTTINTTSITVIANPLGGAEGFVVCENLRFQLGTRTYAGISCFGSDTYLAECKFINCYFYRWTKYCINLTDSYTVYIRDCTFDTINGITGTGDVGTAIYSSDTANLIDISGCISARCDRFVDLSDSSRHDNVIIKECDIELVGYTLDGTGATINNTEYVSYTAIKLSKTVAVDISNNYFEGIDGIAIDLTSVKGFTIMTNFIEGEEPSGVGGDIVLDTFLKLTTCVGGLFIGNAIYNYNTSWITHASAGTGLDSAIHGLDNNYIYLSSTQIYFPTGTVGVIQSQDPVAPTLLNNWANVGSGYQTAGYYRDNNGIVHLQGLVTGDTPNTVIFTLPAGYRPTLQERFLASSDSTTKYARIDVEVSGNVKHIEGGISQDSLCGISFKAKVN